MTYEEFYNICEKINKCLFVFLTNYEDIRFLMSNNNGDGIKMYINLSTKDAKRVHDLINFIFDRVGERVLIFGDRSIEEIIDMIRDVKYEQQKAQRDLDRRPPWASTEKFKVYFGHHFEDDVVVF